MHLIQKTYILVIESLGVGESPDAVSYGDQKANTLAHVAEYVGGLNLTTMARLGFGNITYVKGIMRSDESIAYYGKCRQISDSKDNISGHWEIAGFNYQSLYHSDPEGFFPQFIDKLERELGRKCIYNNKMYSSQILSRYYYDHITEKSFIVYYDKSNLTLTIAAHPDIADENALKEIVKITQEVGRYYGFIRCSGISIIHDQENKIKKKTIVTSSMKPNQTTVLGSCKSSGVPVYFIGNRQNIFADSEFTNIFITKSDDECMEKLSQLESTSGYTNENGQSLIYAVLSDINTRAGNGKDIREYHLMLQKIDQFLQKFLRSMNSSDILIITSSNGNDPSLSENIHTREYLPVIAYSRVLGIRTSGNLGVRRTLADIAETISDIYGLDSHYGADSFWNYMLSQL